MKTCPFCAEEIQDAAIKCKHCGSDLTVAIRAPMRPAAGSGFEAEAPPAGVDVPDTPGSPVERKRRILAFSGLAVLVAVIVGVAIYSSTGNTNTCLDIAAGQADTQRAIEAMNAAGTAATSGDMTGAIAESREAAEAWHEVALDMAADPAIADAADRASDGFEAAADAMEAGDIDLASSLVQEASASIDAATTATSNTSLPIC